MSVPESPAKIPVYAGDNMAFEMRVKDPDDGRRWIYVPRRPAVELIPVLVDLMIWGIANTPVDVPPEQADAVEHREALIAQLTEQANSRLAD